MMRVSTMSPWSARSIAPLVTADHLGCQMSEYIPRFGNAMLIASNLRIYVRIDRLDNGDPLSNIGQMALDLFS